ncbi:MAG: M48 family metalloprotease [Thermoplasmata archaeon]
MALMARMYLAISVLFGILFAFFMVLILLFDLPFLIGLALSLLAAVGVVLLQWAVSPAVIKWIYKIKWVNISYFPASIQDYIRSTCRENRIPVPALGVIEDGNPNAFAFGRTRRSAHLVVTEGIFKYCDEEEQRAVVAHEMGHIVHNDFVVMTVVAMVPLILYIFYRAAFRSIRYMKGGGKGKGQAVAAIAIAGVIAFLAYLFAQLIALMVSRYREYYADDFSARSTGRPNALSSALIKIAYGLAVEGKGQGMEQVKRQTRFETNPLMFFDARIARALAVQATTAGSYSKETLKRVMAWDLWNPWAFFSELTMTHPLPAKRIKALGKIASELGQTPYINFDLEQPESYWDDFLRDIFIRGSWALSIPIAIFVGWWLFPVGLMVAFFISLSALLFFAGLFGFVYLQVYKYPHNFASARVVDLLQEPKASPVRGIPVELSGKIIGRGRPGLFFNEDIKLDDGTGLILLDYDQVLPIINFFVGLLRTESWLGQEVEIRGWYRRGVVPYIELYEMQVGKKRHRLWTAGLKMAGCLAVAIIGVLLFVLSNIALL